MKQNARNIRKNRLFELRQHVKTPPSLHALVELAFHMNSALDDVFPIHLAIGEVRQKAKAGALSYLLEDRLSQRIKLSCYFPDPDERLSWDCVFSEVAQSLQGSDPKRIGVINTGIGLVQAILLENRPGPRHSGPRFSHVVSPRR